MSGWRKRTIMEMAKKAGFIDADWNYTIIVPYLEAFAAQVREDERDRATRENAYVLAEREACAKVCEDSFEEAGGNLAQAIRARGNNMSDYEYKTYGTARFYVPEGMYSIEELEEMLANIKGATRRLDEHLEKSMRPLKEKNND